MPKYILSLQWWLRKQEVVRAAYIIIVVLAATTFSILFALVIDQSNTIKQDQVRQANLSQKLCIQLSKDSKFSNDTVRVPLKTSLKAEAQLLTISAKAEKTKGDLRGYFFLKDYAEQLSNASHKVTLVKKFSCQFQVK